MRRAKLFALVQLTSHTTLCHATHREVQNLTTFYPRFNFAGPKSEILFIRTETLATQAKKYSLILICPPFDHLPYLLMKKQLIIVLSNTSYCIYYLAKLCLFIFKKRKAFHFIHLLIHRR